MSPRVRHVLAFTAAATLVFGCADFDTPVDPAGGAPDALVATPTYTAHILPIIEKRCSIGGCHSLATQQGNLSLAGAESYDNVINITSLQSPALARIRPGRPDSSWLFILIDSDAAARGGFARMPLSSLPLTANQIGTIRNWILQGAPKD